MPSDFLGHLMGYVDRPAWAQVRIERYLDDHQAVVGELLC